MSIIEASVYGFRMLVDGTLAVTIHVDPEHRPAALQLMASPGTAVGVVALKPLHLSEKHARISDSIVPPVVPPERPKVGPACSWLVMRAKDPRFQEWLISKYDQDRPQTEADVAALIRQLVHVESRSDIDGDIEAEGRFETYIRQPWLRFNQEVVA